MAISTISLTHQNVLNQNFILNRYPSILIKIFNYLSKNEQLIAVKVCHLWSQLNVHPFGVLKVETSTSWIKKAQSWFPKIDFSALSLGMIKKGMKSSPSALLFPDKSDFAPIAEEEEALDAPFTDGKLDIGDISDRTKEKKMQGLGPPVRESRKEISQVIQPTERYLNQTPKNTQHRYELKTLQAQFSKDPYLRSVVNEITETEKKHSQTHYPTYHALNINTYVFTLFTKTLLLICNLGKDELKDRALEQMEKACWLRFPAKEKSTDPKTIQQFFAKYSMESKSDKGDDHDPEIQRLLLCLNPFLFGNLFVDGEETWLMFLKNQSVNPPNFEKLFNLLCNHFNILPVTTTAERKINEMFRKKYALKLEALLNEIVFKAHVYLHKLQKNCLVKNGKSREDFDQIQFANWGVIYQFLIPKEEIDKCVYVSKAYGMCDHQFDPLPTSEVLEKVNADPQSLKGVQLRMLASVLTDFSTGIISNAFGYNVFFQSKDALDLFKEVQKTFLEMIFVTGEIQSNPRSSEQKARS